MSVFADSAVFDAGAATPTCPLKYAPNGPFALYLRLYWPKPEALDGTWKTPKLQRSE